MKKSITIFSLSILCLFLFSGCSFNFAEKKEKASVKLTTYCSSDFGIEFKYPSDWSLQKDGRFLYLYQGGVSGRIGIMNGGSFSEVEKMTDNISSSEIINLAGTKVLKRTYLPIKPKNMAASAGYHFLVPQDKVVAVMNYYSDRNSDILDIIANSVKLVGSNGCGDTEKNISNSTSTSNIKSIDDNVVTSISNVVSEFSVYDNKVLGYKFNYPSKYKTIVANAEGLKFGVSFFDTEIESSPFKTTIALGDQNYVLLLTDAGDVVEFDFGKEGVKNILDLKTEKYFSNGVVEKINNINFFKLVDFNRVKYIVKNPNNEKFLVFEIYIPKEYEKDLNDEKVVNLRKMLETLSFN